MTRRAATTFWCLGFLFVMSVSTARAQRGGGGWDWLDRLSGPGSFNGFFVFTSFCVGGGDGDDSLVRYSGCRPDDSRTWLNLGFSYQKAGEDPDRDFPKVTLWSFEPSIDFRIFTLGAVGVEWGFAYGLHHFGGEAFPDFWRMSFAPVRVGVVIDPGSDAFRIQTRFTTTYFVDGFTAADFGSSSDFEARGELVPAVFVGVVFDLSPLFD